MSKTDNIVEEKRTKRQYLSQSDVPAVSLDQALRIAKILTDEFAKQPTKPLHIAAALGITPTSSRFRVLSGAANAYGITIGAYNAAEIALTELGKRICAPVIDHDDIIAKKEAFLKPRVISDFLQRYNNNKLPSTPVAHNVLQELGVPAEKIEAVFELIVSAASDLGMVTELKGNKYVDLERALALPGLTSDEAMNHETPLLVDDNGIPPTSDGDVLKQNSETKVVLKPIFIAHGKNTVPLKQLTSVLDQFKIPYKVAVDEPNTGRPVSKKVSDIMNECGSAIFIFSRDGEPVDAAIGGLPNLNVTYELGAASVLYGEKIIIFKESELSLPSDFSGLAYISFEKDKLDSKTMDLLKELIQMGFVKITAA